MTCLSLVSLKLVYQIPLITIVFPAACGVLFCADGSRAIDNYSGQSDEHRRGWVEERLLFLSSVFAIDICAYAVMSNHVHVMLHIDMKQAQPWSDKEVVTR
jgi:hypothetical protein